jgi:peptidoglycan/LPS O-acetylase OafA/YrhL
MGVLGVLSYGIYLWHEGVTDIYRDIFNVPIFNGSFPAAWPSPRRQRRASPPLSYFVVERPAPGASRTATGACSPPGARWACPAGAAA